MVSAASSINQVTNVCLSDGEPPAQLEVSFSGFGDLIRIQNSSTRGGDPLILMLGKVEPGCELQILNISKQPDAEWSDKSSITKLPVDTMKPLGDGRFGLVFGNKQAEAVGVRPGDVFEIRQVDSNGNASPPTSVALQQKNRVDLRLASYGTLEVQGVAVDAFRNETVRLRPYPDGAAPMVLTGLLQIESTAEGKGRLSGRKAIEPGATVFVHNEATHETFSGSVGADRRFAVDFTAKAGAPIHLWVTDHNGVTTDLGLTTYAPKCVKSGPLCAASLAQAV